MLSFHNDPKIKEKYIARLQAHYQADEIAQGFYWENGRGCAVGCTIHSNSYKSYETELGIPVWMARVEERIFEGLPNHLAKEFPLKFLESIPVGFNLEIIKKPFLLLVAESALDNFDHLKYPNVKKSIDKVIKLLKNPNSMGPEFEEFQRATYDAVADCSAAYSYFFSFSSFVSVPADSEWYDSACAANSSCATEYIARAACAAYVDDYVSWSDYAALAVTYAARKNKYIYFSEKLIDLFKGLK